MEDTPEQEKILLVEGTEEGQLNGIHRRTKTMAEQKVEMCAKREGYGGLSRVKGYLCSTRPKSVEHPTRHAKEIFLCSHMLGCRLARAERDQQI